VAVAVELTTLVLPLALAVDLAFLRLAVIQVVDGRKDGTQEQIRQGAQGVD